MSTAIAQQVERALKEAYSVGESVNEMIDELESKIRSELPAVETPHYDHFTPGLYMREFHAPAGTLLTSKIHKTEHPYIISKGMVSVYDGEKVVLLCAPHHGVTKPGTRRVIYVHEDLVWTTAHFNPDNETVEQIEERIIEKRVPKLSSEHKHLLINNL